jgi:hypothetical protein
MSTLLEKQINNIMTTIPYLDNEPVKEVVETHQPY